MPEQRFNLNSINIRPAKKSDSEQIYQLIQVAMGKYALDSGITGPLPSLQESIEDISKYLEDYLVFLAFLGEKLVGTIRLEYFKDHAMISRLAILPDYHGLGLGGRLLNYAIERLMQDKFKKVYLYTALENKSLLSFYISKGFVVESQSNDRGYTRGLLRRDLT